MTAGPWPGWMMVTVTSLAWVRERRSERRMVAARSKEDDDIILYYVVYISIIINQCSDIAVYQ